MLELTGKDEFKFKVKVHILRNAHFGNFRQRLQQTLNPRTELICSIQRADGEEGEGRLGGGGMA